MRSDILRQAQAIRASMDAAAGLLTDAQAAKAPGLTVKAGEYMTLDDRLYRCLMDTVYALAEYAPAWEAMA